MIEPDPNQKLEENLKKDGEFLRDVDKGMSSTETGFNIDLGTVRDSAAVEHSEVIQEMQEASEPSAPAAPDAPVLDAPHAAPPAAMELAATPPATIQEPPEPSEVQSGHAETM